MADFRLGENARAAGYRLEGFESIGSTNAEALAAAIAGDPGGRWFAALQQTAGRGRRGRPWQSPYGNLAASLLIVPDADPGVAKLVDGAPCSIKRHRTQCRTMAGDHTPAHPVGARHRDQIAEQQTRIVEMFVDMHVERQTAARSDIKQKFHHFPKMIIYI